MKTFFKNIGNTIVKKLRKHPLICNFVLSVMLAFVLEVLGRQTFDLSAVGFVDQRSKMFLYSIFIIFVTYSVTLITKRRLFSYIIVTLLWSIVGIVNFMMLSSRNTPFTYVDITLMKSVLPVMNNYFSPLEIGAMGALILILSSQATSAGGGCIGGDLLCMIAQLSFSIYLTVFKGLSQRYSAITINKWMFIYASICYIPFSYQDIAGIEWNSISTAAIYQVLYVVLCGSFIAYICIMTAQKLMRPTVVSMYNYVQPIVASIAAILMGIGSFGWEKGVAIALVFLGVYFVTQSKSKADLEGVS